MSEGVRIEFVFFSKFCSQFGCFLTKADLYLTQVLKISQALAYYIHPFFLHSQIYSIIFNCNVPTGKGLSEQLVIKRIISNFTESQT